MNDEHCHAHLMHEQRAWANNNRAWIDAEWDALPDVPRTIAGHLAARVGGE